jgi:hypothetical protein
MMALRDVVLRSFDGGMFLDGHAEGESLRD